MTITVHDLRDQTTWENVGPWLESIAANMRTSDVEEVKASSTLTPLEALQGGTEVSTYCWIITNRNDDPIAVFGCAPMALPGMAAVWMLGTDGILSEATSIARQTRPYMDLMNREYHVLWNYIDDRNKVSMRWLKWAGFKIVKSKPNHGPEGRLFHSFARTSHV